MTTEKTNAYYDADDLNRFAEMGQCGPLIGEPPRPGSQPGLSLLVKLIQTIIK